MTVTMGIFRSQTIAANSSPPKSADDSREPKMGVLRSQTVVHHLSSHFHKSSSSRDLKEQHDDEPELGILRSCTDPLDKKASKSSGKSNGTQTTPSSENNSGTTTPVRKLERVRSIYERPSSVIPKYYVVAEQVHRFKMRKCEGMRCSDEEGVLIKKMQKWDWKHATHPGEAPPPVGPKNESWCLEGVALEQTHSHSHSRHGGAKEDEE